MPQTTILEEYIDDFNSNDGVITQTSHTSWCAEP